MTALSAEVALTRLAGGPPLAPDEIRAIPASTWSIIAERAHEHRLEPLLYFRWNGDDAVPVALRDIWAAAYRQSAIAALAQRAALLSLVEDLGREGITAVALKGAWLAWNIYPEPALRPLRDLDLLIAPEQALAARAHLLAKGWVEEDDDGLPAEEWLERFKHLPALVAPDGTVLELHVRLWDEDGRTPANVSGVLYRATALADHPALRFPDPVDMLMHLAVHATFHRFDAGPLMLVDFDQLLAKQAFDWESVWPRAASEGWDRALALVLAATRRWGSSEPTRIPDLPLTPPAELVEALPELLCKPLAAREADIAEAKRARADVPLGEKLRRAFARRERFGSTREYLAWVAGQLRAQGSERREALVAMDAWLVG
ncbi:nucleotidyltransferase family protein [Qipengyuania flava]|uniref:nucleotidyltransferase family protein n=1 Tax=Qipengyuania flava TaxID=192812 RepID=UPI001C6295A4|nr:nucleotidyltransferase family protein [Qipengyuania flava]QYJ07448.1 nucleotidyltransferase family protein [Qipengyuania flava]